MTTYRRMMLSGGTQGAWQPLDEETARRQLATPAAGVGSVGDALADQQQYIEASEDGGQTWATASYWHGARDHFIRARLEHIQKLEGDSRRLYERAAGILESAGATIEGFRQQIAAAQAGLAQALKGAAADKVTAKDLLAQARDIDDQVKACRRELDRVPPPATATEAVVA